ncbi:serine protease AprX [Kroppenstedtia guangzhouensis]|uniref:Serine protease AprX n=1 Tax=Kroppenstedtia guangzhouensis TaxID=1274356 RepID=A0ABQ1GUL0_9BACL|nr:S8 family peptidase [Kroppenstedtia guangzhouensis]GGA50732.1 serine protease AprX [Kroppenstedtia guangzhouensis]
MSMRETAWFEKPDRFDPGLIQELRRFREIGGHEERDVIPVIIRLNREADSRRHQDVIDLCKNSSCNRYGGELGLVGGIYGKVSPNTIREMADHEGVYKIYHDREVRAFLDIGTKSVGVTDVRVREGLTGKGVTIAVVDTGIHPHDDLMKPVPRIVAFEDLIHGRKEPYDDQGHGTHCAGDAAGNGYRSEGLYAGPAPEAKLVGVKVLDKEGSGQLSTVIKGVDWCVVNKEKYGIRIISLSLGAPAVESYRDDPLAQAVEAAWHRGIVVLAAAGNEGPLPGTISTPGLDPLILTVGAADDRNTPDDSDDIKASYSSRGPTVDLLVKPDVYAPGTHIISLSVPDSPLERQLPENRVGEHYINLSGTSMATPFCAGVVALLLEANPQLSPNDVKSILMFTTREMTGDQAGYLRVGKAIDLAKEYLSSREVSV